MRGMVFNLVPKLNPARLEVQLANQVSSLPLLEAGTSEGWHLAFLQGDKSMFICLYIYLLLT